MSNQTLNDSETNNTIYQFQAGYIRFLKINSEKTFRDQVNKMMYLSFKINTTKYVKGLMNKKTTPIIALIIL